MSLKIFTLTFLSLQFIVAHGNVQKRHVLLHRTQNSNDERPVDAVQGPLTAEMPTMTSMLFFENKAKRMRGVISALARKVHLKKSIASPEEQKMESADLLLAEVYYFTSMIIWIILFLLIAFLYKQNWAIKELDEETLKALEPDTDFKNAFLCHEEPKQCCWACWCGGIRWADAQSAAGMFGFWVAIAIWLALGILDNLTHWVFWCLVAMLFTYFRSKLRTKLKMKNEWSNTMCDCALWCCCMCCAIFQEVRHVQELSKDNEKEEEQEPAY